MILESVFNLISGLIKIVFGWINLPDLPDSVTSIIDELFSLISGSMGIIGIFIDMTKYIVEKFIDDYEEIHGEIKVEE